MSYKPSWKRGDWLSICDRCGFKFKASQLQETWDGFMVCAEDWEERQPQDFVAGVPDQQRLPWTRPEGADTNTDSDGYVWPWGYVTITGTDELPDNEPSVSTGFNRILTLDSDGNSFSDGGAMKDKIPDSLNVPGDDTYWYVRRSAVPSITYSNNDNAG